MSMADHSQLLGPELDNLFRMAQVFHQSNFEPVEPMLFRQEILDIQGQWNKVEPDAPSIQEKQILSERWAQIKEAQDWEALTRRDIRDLVSIPEAFGDPELVELIIQQRPLNKRLLKSVMHSYLSFWQVLKPSIRQKWISTISEALEDPSLSRMPWPALHRWRKASSWLLGDQPDKELAKSLLFSTGPLKEAITNYLLIDAAIGEGSMGNAAREYLLIEVLRLDRESFTEQLDQALNFWLNPKADYQWLGQLIIKVNTLKDDSLIEFVKNWFLKADGFGDLRLYPQGGWHHIPTEAKQIFTGWLSKEDLEFFFKMVLPEREDPHRRREFWEQYLPCVIRSRVLISEEDAWRNREVLTDMKAKGKTLPGSIKNSSVFIMETKHYYILEFSEVGNAAYIYWTNENKKFSFIYQKLEQLLQFRNLRDLNANDLKLGTAIPQLSGTRPCENYYSIRITHTGNWQQFLKRWLNLRGIRP